MLAPGHTIDRYVVESIIGTGGTAVVYRVRHRQLKTLHALKVLSVTSSAIKERMFREGRVQAALKHLNVVAVNDVLDIDGSPGLLLEYIEGPSLEDALRRYRLTVLDAEVLFQGVLAGVRHAHSHGLVHRDIKPANVLLARTADGFVPKVTDFGLAKVLNGEGEGTGSTRSGIAMGTPHYMSPEQIRDARNVDQRADVFSLGCILYELVTGERTFPGDDALSIYNAIIAGEYVPPRVAVPDLPERFDIAIRGALALDPNVRIPDCVTLLDVLQGRRVWDAAATPVPAGSPRLNIPPPDRQAPPETLPLAARQDDGSTPPPAPDRSVAAPARSLGSGGGLGVETSTEEAPSGAHKALDSSEVSLARAREKVPAATTRSLHSDVGPDATLGGGEPLVSSEDAPARSSLPIWALFAGSIALLSALVLVGGIIAALAIVIVQVSSPVTTRNTAVEPSVGLSVPATHEVATVVVAPMVVPTVPVIVPTPDGTPVAPTIDMSVKPPIVRSTDGVARPDPTPTVVRPTVVPPVTAPALVAEAVTVKLLSTPPTARVKIDGKVVPGATPLKVGLTAGRHAVEVTLGDEQHTFAVDVTASVENRWCYNFESDALIEGACR